MGKIFLVDNLRYLKMVNGVTNSDVIEELQMRSFGNYVSGRALPPIDVLIKLADYFQVTLDELVRVDLKQGRISQVEDEAKKYGHTDLEQRVERLERMIQKLSK